MQLLHLNMQKGGFVYMMSSIGKSTLYVGVTSNLVKRVFEYRNKIYPGSFTAQYNCVMLVYYCFFETIEQAIAEEKRIKSGNRIKKEVMIETLNPNWDDLWESIQG